MALRGRCTALFGVDPDPRACRLALERGLVDTCGSDPAEIFPQADLLILAAPVGEILSLLVDLPRLHPGPAVVLDLGSTKLEICRAMAALPPRFEPLGGHPMTGKELSSFENAEADLYQYAPFVLAPLPNTTPRARDLALQILAAIGARPLWLDPAVHDRWVSGTSHLPYLLAVALAGSTSIEAAPLIGPGFRSTARLAGSSQRMMLDTLLTNRENILERLGDFQVYLAELQSAILAADASGLDALLSRGADRYRSLLSPDP
jgi:prephenate dehydrogenase